MNKLTFVVLYLEGDINNNVIDFVNEKEFVSAL